MSKILLFPEGSQVPSQDDFEREVAARFGLVPNFFRSATDAPLVIREMWQFAKSAYLDTPIPSLFKERLFVYLSRFCEVRYCVTRHCGFLLGLGRAAGDPNVQVMTISQVTRLLRRDVPNQEYASLALARLEALAEPIDWPSPETSHDDDLLTASTVLFLQPARADRAKRALRIALGGERFELLVALLTFIRAAHYWTLMHPEIQLEDDLNALLHEHEELARLLSEDTEAARSEMGTRLFDELKSLHDLSERRELRIAKRALEESGQQKDLLLKEVDHRIKNSLQIVSSLLSMQANSAGAAAGQFRTAAARVAAIAAVHQQLHKFDDVGMVWLDRYLTDLCQSISAASSNSDRPWLLVVNAEPIRIKTDVAMPLGLIVNELIANAVQHSRPDGNGGQIDITLRAERDRFSVSIADPGNGPSEAQASETDSVHSGLGTRIVESLARQIEAMVTRANTSSGYTIAVTVPLSREADLS